MDNNNPTANLNTAPGTMAPQMPTINPTPTTPTPSAEPPKESKKLILWFGLGLVVIIILVGGIYLYFSKQQTAETNQQAAQVQTPPPVIEENLENEINNINVEENLDSDFATLDQDLQEL